jgi:hypothetical protein
MHEMHDVDAIETFNVKQLATAADRLLLVGPHRRRATATPVGGPLPARGGASNLADKALPHDRWRWLRGWLSREPAACDDEGSLVVLGILELSIATGGVDRSDFERYGQAIGEDLGGWVGMKNIGRELGRDIGGLLWENPLVTGGIVGGVRGGGLKGGAGGGFFGGAIGGFLGFGLGRIFR